MSPRDTRPRVVLLVDRPDWAFDFVARAFAERLSRRFEFHIVRRDVEPVHLDPTEIDLLYVFFWGDRSYVHLGLPPEKIVKEVASWRWAIEERWGRLAPEQFAAMYLSDCATVTTPSRGLQAVLRGIHPRVFHVPNGVDTRLFEPRRRSGSRLRIGWAGNPSDPTKGLRDILEPACTGRFELEASNGKRTQRELARLYRRADVIAIASEAESQPLPLLEGMASGCFPVATHVGIVPELVVNGVNGLVVERRPEAFREAFAWCERNLAAVRRAGRLNAELMVEERHWDALAGRFGDVLDAALGRAPSPPADAPAKRGPARAALARGVVPARVAFVTPEFVSEDPRAGGLGNYLQRMTQALVQQGQCAEVFVTSHSAPGMIDFNGVAVHRVRAATERRPVRAALRVLGALRLTALGSTLRALVDAWSLAAALRRRMQVAPFDLVQSSDYRGVGLFVSPGGDTSHVIRCSVDDREVARLNGDVLRHRVGIDALVWLALRRADRLYAPSRLLAGRLGQRGLRVQVIQPPVFLDAKPATERLRNLPERYFVHFGQISPLKGAPLLAEALVRVLAEQSDFVMLWAGRDRTGLFQSCAQRWGSQRERVRYLGELEKPELYALVAGAEAAVLPSGLDNLPNTVIESLMLGVPVLGTTGASLEELVEPGVTGILVPQGDSDALADAMLRQWRGETPVRRGFVWQRAELRPETAVARLLELGGVHGPA
jgi:glycosyltransferase involved in cell wall biosynthesis